MSEPTEYVFDRIPPPEALLRNGGLPGVEYLYCLASNSMRARNEGWLQLHDMPMFSVAGHACMMLGRGRPVPQARAGTVRCRFYVDEALDAALATTAALPPPAKKPTSATKLASATT